jgi:hypothetical protein
MEDENRKQEPPDKDWVAYIPGHEWLALMNLCDNLEQSQAEFQKAVSEFSPPV